MRKKKTKRRLIIICFAVLLFVSIVMGHTKLTSMAKEERSMAAPYYKSIRIQEGDSLLGIAGQYREGSSMSLDEYVKQLKRMNRLKGDTIHAGQYLTVVYFE